MIDMLEEKKVPRVRFKTIRGVFLVIIIVAVSFWSGYFFGFKGFVASIKQFPEVTISRENPPDKKELNFSLFWKVWDTLSARYYDKEKLIPAKMVYGAIQGMVASIGDPYTVFLPPKENKVVQEDLQGNFEGVGIQIGFRGNQLAVVAPLPDSPAEKAGVKAGDYIIGIKDEAKKVDRGTVGITLPDAVEIIRGPAGSKITLALLREGNDNPIQVDIVRDSINVPSVALSYVGENKDIAYVRVLKFGGDTLNEWNEKVPDILTKPDLKGMIVDVRNNPGGYLQGAVDLASDFLESGSVVVIEQDGDGTKQEYKTSKIPRFRNTKMVILVNGGSASASEIFSGALRDERKIELIGDTTFGKGTIQEPQQIEDGAGLHITIAKWLTPSEYWVNEKGLEPDIKVENNPDTTEDEQLQKAIEEIQKLS